jgi:hypothetical protein
MDVLKVDGKEVARETVPLILQWDETFDIGADGYRVAAG